MQFTRVCPVTKKENTLTIPNVSEEGYIQWTQGYTYIQDCFPELTADEREFIKTGIMPQTWDEMFPEEPADDDKDYWDPETDGDPWEGVEEKAQPWEEEEEMGFGFVSDLIDKEFGYGGDESAPQPVVIKGPLGENSFVLIIEP